MLWLYHTVLNLEQKVLHSTEQHRAYRLSMRQSNPEHSD